MKNIPHLKLLAEEALKPGIKQVRGKLRVDDGFCISGLACHVFQRETGRGRWGVLSKHPDGTIYAFGVDLLQDDWSGGFPPVPVSVWYGTELLKYTTLNDDEERSLAYIAHTILKDIEDELRRRAEKVQVRRGSPRHEGSESPPPLDSSPQWQDQWVPDERESERATDVVAV